MRVAVVDDSIIVREGLRRLLEAEGHHVLDVLEHPDLVAGAITARPPEVVILDIRMPPTFTDEGLHVASALRRAHPQLGILLLSQYAVAEYATRLLESGTRATGYLLKDRIFQANQLSQALHRLAEGGTVIDPDVVGELVATHHTSDPLARLTERERDVLRLMAGGLSDKGIAQQLYVSVNTVGTHSQRVFRKLDLPDGMSDNRRVLAVLAFLQHRFQRSAGDPGGPRPQGR
jgi:DNA-binding NarL/FixJ family response regulator